MMDEKSKRRTLHIRLEIDEHEKLRDLSFRTKISMNHFVRIAIREFLDRQDSDFSLPGEEGA